MSNIDPAASRANPAAPAPAENQFRKYWNLGYRRLVPVIPPGAPISPKSHLARKPENVGKVPGTKKPDGRWRSFGWTQHETTEADLDAWHAMGAGVGIKTGRGLVGFDVDVLDQARHKLVVGVLRELLGAQELARLPFRIGQEPKFLVPVNVPEEFNSIAPIIFDGSNDRVEVLYEGRFFVAHGIHPATGKPYKWPRGVPSVQSLNSIDLAELFGRLTILPRASRKAARRGSADRVAVDQASLTAPLEVVRKVMDALPNEFADRETYIHVGIALKAALPDHPHEAFELYWEWCDKWEGVGSNGRPNEYEAVFAEFETFHPPFSMGFNYLKRLADKHGDGSHNFDVIEDEPNEPELAAAGDWPEPADMFGDNPDTPLPPLPDNALPPVIQAWVDDTAERTGFAKSMLAGAAMAVVASAVDNRILIQVNERDTSWKVRPILWFALVEDVGGGKTPVQEFAKAPLVKLESQYAREDQPKLDAYAAALKATRRKDAPQPGPRPPSRRCLFDDFTVEGLRDKLIENPRGGLISNDELTQFIGSFDAYKQNKGSDRARALKLFDGGPLLVDRAVGGSVRVPVWGSCILGGIQPTKIRKIASTLDDDGLLQRFVVIVGPGTKGLGVDRLPNDAAEKAYEELITGLAGFTLDDAVRELLPSKGIVRLSREAHVVRRRFFERVRTLAALPKVGEAWRSHLSKWDGMFMRMLAVFHAAEQFPLHDGASLDVPVSEETAERCERFSDFLLINAIRFYESYVGTGEAGKLARWIAGHVLSRPETYDPRRKSNKSRKDISRRDVAANNSDVRKSGETVITGAMRLLEIEGWCRPIEGKRDNFGPLQWELNPSIFDLFKDRGEQEKLRRLSEREKIEAATRERRKLDGE